MVCVIVNYATAIYACWHNGIDLSHFPTILNWCDNTSACKWINTRCKESLIGHTLGRLFLWIDNGIRSWSGRRLHLDVWNVVADDISHLKRSSDGHYDHSKLTSDHPLLCSCRTFQPSKSLLTMLWDIVLNNPLQIR